MNQPEDPKSPASYRVDEDIDAESTREALDAFGIENPAEEDPDAPDAVGSSELDEFGMPKIARPETGPGEDDGAAIGMDADAEPMPEPDPDDLPEDALPDLDTDPDGEADDGEHDDLHATGGKSSFWQNNKLAISILAGTLVVAGGGWVLWGQLGSGGGSPPPAVSPMSGAEQGAIDRAFEAMHEETPEEAAAAAAAEADDWDVNFDDFDMGATLPPPATPPAAPEPESPTAVPGDNTLEIANEWVEDIRALDQENELAEIVLARNPQTEGLRPGSILLGEQFLDEVIAVNLRSAEVVVRTQPASMAQAFEELRVDQRGEPVEHRATVDDTGVRESTVPEPEPVTAPPEESVAETEATDEDAPLWREAVSPRSEQVAMERLESELADQRALAMQLAEKLDDSEAATESLTITADEQKDRIGQLEDQVAALRRERTRLQERVAAAEKAAEEARERAPVTTAREARPAPPAPATTRSVQPVPAAPASTDGWRISAMTDGQALLLSGSGEYYAVTEGDRLPELGRVHRIDEARGRVLTEGAVLQR